MQPRSLVRATEEESPQVAGASLIITINPHGNLQQCRATFHRSQQPHILDTTDLAEDILICLPQPTGTR